MDRAHRPELDATVPRQDPSVVAALMTQVTSRIGIVPTFGTYAYYPYLLARLVATLDQVSAGRIGWNVVTGSSDFAAMNFGMQGMPEHDLRYDMADEYMQVCAGLWGSWEPGAIVADRNSGVVEDHTKMIVVAIGIYAYARYGLVGSPTGLVLAHTCLAVPFVVTSVGASLAGIDPRLEQAALGLGATPAGAFFQITLPLIRPGALVGALFAFITSFDEQVVALFISGSGAVTLPRRMCDDLLFEIDPTIAAVATPMIVQTAVLMATAQLLRWRAPAVPA
jgi:ABC-type proline/glycine betaine transport system permease subunit